MKNRNVFLLNSNGSPLLAEKTGRNQLCKCKSGKKTKNCCGNSTNYYLSKSNEELIKNNYEKTI